MTRLVVPYVATMLRPETVASVGPYAEFIELDPADPAAYPRLLYGLWEAAEDVVIVEQDVEVPSSFLDDFAACRNEWCVLDPADRPGLAWMGCVRFRAALMVRFPDVVAWSQAVDDDGDRAWTWHKIDVRLERFLRAERVIPCCHSTPPAVHHHVYADR